MTILLSSFAFYTWQVLYYPNFLVERESKYFLVNQGDTFKDVQDNLYEGRYVNDLVAFSFLAKLMNYDTKVKAGRYLIERDMTNLEAIRLLRSGAQAPANITFNNVRLIDELAPRITQNILLTEEQFNEALANYIETNEEGWTRENIISMFLPNTYEVYYNVTGEELIQRMNREYHNFWNERRLAQADSIGLTPREVSVLASIVQAESVKPDEGPKIAGLYLNRLKRGIALQADPTLVFAAGDFTIKRVLNVHKEIDSPYNTYLNAGLPPGPINMPNIGSLEAVLNYNDHDFIYMCAREDFSGYHNFADNIAEHNANARRYQKQLTIEIRKGRELEKANQ